MAALAASSSVNQVAQAHTSQFSPQYSFIVNKLIFHLTELSSDIKESFIIDELFNVQSDQKEAFYGGKTTSLFFLLRAPKFTLQHKFIFLAFLLLNKI